MLKTFLMLAFTSDHPAAHQANVGVREKVCCWSVHMMLIDRINWILLSPTDTTVQQYEWVTDQESKLAAYLLTLEPPQNFCRIRKHQHLLYPR